MKKITITTLVATLLPYGALYADQTVSDFAQILNSSGAELVEKERVLSLKTSSLPSVLRFALDNNIPIDIIKISQEDGEALIKIDSKRIIDPLQLNPKDFDIEFNEDALNSVMREQGRCPPIRR